MDLADIRKKAKARKEKELQGQARYSTFPPGTSIQGVPSKASSRQSDGKLPEEPGVTGKPVDPLEALFAFPSDTGTAAEEGYLQGLEGNRRPEEKKKEWLTFSLGKEEYALDIEFIHEIIKLREITEIPNVPDFILGIISLRGIVVPVFDLIRRLKLGTVEISPTSRIIICQFEDRTAGLLVDRICQVVRIPEKQIEPPPAMLTGVDRELLGGVGRHDGRMIILLNLENVLDSELI